MSSQSTTDYTLPPCVAEADGDRLPLQQPVLVRTDSHMPHYDAITNTAGEIDAVLLEIIQRRVLSRPKRTKKPKKMEDPCNSPKKRRRRTKPPLPAWLAKGATLDDMVSVLEMDQKSDEIYIDVSSCASPHDTLTLPMVRHFIRKARAYPSMCSEWNTVSIKHNGERLAIPMNGRNATRTDGAAATRAYAAMDVFANKMDFKPITTNVLKDLGYGSKKAAQFRTQWLASRGQVGDSTNICNDDRNPESDQDDEFSN
jgi:hypothetical protein